ncbi:type II toxin-antitoxin system HicA family toxin [Candidatus Poriferisodalis sp.]|uniref:type II toxin-antitoxin system HicA family toxin n=1 Tax=Candidatus Poriferisodalis sp. TaxID=3101277 RepID=UPI003B02E898
MTEVPHMEGPRVLYDEANRVLCLETTAALLQRLRDGWAHARTRGSHRQFRHPDKPGAVTIPVAWETMYRRARGSTS